jgi:hypothetical protein
LESLRKRELTNQQNSIPEFRKLVADNLWTSASISKAIMENVFEEF